MRFSLISVLFLLISASLSSQGIKGTIKDSEGEPVAYATVYIQELKQGTTANTKGDYEIRLPAGKYTIIFQSLGFSPEIKTVSLTTSMVTINIILQDQYYEIPEVRITASGEDPAYAIMRKVIGMAPYYLNQVEYYQADVYIKGNLEIIRIPKIIQRSMKAEVRSESGSSVSSDIMKEGDTYMMESFNEVEFRAPDKYHQRVISSRSTFPDQGSDISPMDFIQASFYEPVMVEMFISPLSPDAFFHYKFKYSGLSVQGNNIINKIEVIPKRKSQQLFEGTIYVIEDLWCLHSVDLYNDNIAGRIRIQQLCVPVQEDTWLPVSLKFDINISIIGVKADAGYGSSIKYKEVRNNLALQKPAALLQGYNKNSMARVPEKDTVTSSTQIQINRILSKEELTNRDMVKLSGLMQKQSKENLPDSVKNSLEIKDNTTYIIEKDAGKKDSAFWAEIRPIPLSENEAKSIRVSDSINASLSLKEQKADTTKTPGKKKSPFARGLNAALSGHSWSDTTGFRFSFGGLIEPGNLSFNTVDGFAYGVNFRINKSWKNGQSFSVYPNIRWTFSREALLWNINTQYNLNNNHQDQFYLRIGRNSRDFNSAGGINPLLNSFTSLFMRLNYMKVYDSRQLFAGLRHEIANGLTLQANATFEERRLLENTTDYSIIKNDRIYTDNIPGNSYLEAVTNPYHELNDQRHAEFAVVASYTPRQRYTLVNGRKIPRGSDYPTFSLRWEHGINNYSFEGEELRHYDMLKFEASNSKSLGAFGEFRWRFRAGGFLDNSFVSFYDFNHFNSQPIAVLIDDYEDAFKLPSYYSLSTPEYYTEFHTKYTTPYLLLKLIPGLSNTLMRENLSLSYLWSRYQMAYTEIGYSISEVLLIGELGVYAGFNNFSFGSVGFKAILRIN